MRVARGAAKQSALVAVATSKEVEQQLCKMPREDSWTESQKRKVGRPEVS